MLPTRRRFLPALLLALAGLFATVTVNAPSAEASSTLLCKGFKDCSSKGYSNHGYSAVYLQMWWRMFAGHNCTNYVAYRMVKAGMPATRPWSGSGDARNWGIVFADKTDQTPKIGSVAWWSYNHVAYVERIIDKDTIVISEDHYGGDFDWRKITRSGGGWPNGFIHLVDEQLEPSAPPTIAGRPQVGAELVAKNGTWPTGSTFSYQWYANGQPISGANTKTYRPTAGLVGHPLKVRVKASTTTGYKSGFAYSAATADTAPGEFTQGAEPVISGTPKVTNTLTATTPTYAPLPDDVEYTWYADGVPIAGADDKSLTLGAAQYGRTITVMSSATRRGYNRSDVASAPTAKVAPAKLLVNAEPTLRGQLYGGKTLTVSGAELSPTAGTVASYLWQRDGKGIKGATGASYLLGAADVGHKISVHIAYRKPGYVTVIRDLAASGLVRALPKVTMSSRESRQVTVRVEALGIAKVPGQIQIKSASGSGATVSLANGEATFTGYWVKSGKQTFRVRYLGSSKVAASAEWKTITLIVK